MSIVMEMIGEQHEAELAALRQERDDALAENERLRGALLKVVKRSHQRTY